MKKLHFKIPLYEVNVTLVQSEGKSDTDAIKKILMANHVKKEYIEDIVDGVARGGCNGGETFRDFRYKRMLVFFYPFENDRRRAETYSHEKRHIEDRVLEYFSVDDIESAGLLAGFLGGMFYKFERL